jgi:hypothetical protein
MSLCNCLHGIKVPTGYSDNVSGMVNTKTLKVHFKKSHNCDILIRQFLPIAIRGILLVKVQDTIMKLCSFFNAISQKVMDPMKLTKLQDDLILTMCNLDTIFSPSFFDHMPHLLVHMVHKMKYLDLVFLHQMYPFKRFMTVLKKYVHNQSRPECCMVQDDEDITTSDITTPSIEMHGPIMRSRAQQLHHQVNSFLCSFANDLENRWLPNDLIVIRNQGVDHEGHMGHQVSAGDLRKHAQ